MAKPTASSLERALACPASLVLPQVHTTSEYAKRGTEIARFIRLVIGGASVEAAAETVGDLEWRATCLALDWKKLAGDLSEVQGEMAYALDVETDDARRLGSNLGRHYPPTSATEFCGTSDIEGERIDGIPVVVDVKSGQPVTLAAHNPQIRFFALVKHLLTGAPEVEGRIAYVGEDGSVWSDCHTFSAFDLESFGDELRALPARIAAARDAAATSVPTVSTGDHCRYCPAKPACPAYVALARTMVTDIDAARVHLPVMTPEEQGRAWAKAKAVESMLETVLDALKAMAKQAPFPLENGQTVKMVTQKRRAFVQANALRLLEAKGATPEEIAEVYTETVIEKVQACGSKTGVKAPRKRKAA